LVGSGQISVYDPRHLTLNNESVRLARRQYRELITSEIRKTFLPQTPLTVSLHWDGKLLPSLTGHDNVDRLAVTCFGSGVMKLLAVPPLASDTGEAHAGGTSLSRSRRLVRNKSCQLHGIRHDFKQHWSKRCNLCLARAEDGKQLGLQLLSHADIISTNLFLLKYI